MKVTRETQGFMPIKIILETEEDARFLYELLACDIEDIRSLIKKSGYNPSSSLDTELFAKLCEVYMPGDC